MGYSVRGFENVACTGLLVGFRVWGFGFKGFTIGPKVVPFWASYLEFYKVLPKRNYFGAYG